MFISIPRIGLFLEKRSSSMEYGRNIVVKGVGKASSRPDLIVISFDLDSFSKSYDKAMSLAFDKYIFRKYRH